MKPFEDNTLTIVVSGTESKDAQVFIGKTGIGLIQKIRVYAEAEIPIPQVELSMPAISYKNNKELPKINDDDIVIAYGNFISNYNDGGTVIPTSNSVAVFLGEEQLGVIAYVEFVADVKSHSCSLTIGYDYAAHNLIKSQLEKLAKIPHVNIDFIGDDSIASA